MSGVTNFGLSGIGGQVQFGRAGPQLASGADGFVALGPDGTGLVRLQAANPQGPADVVTLQVLQQQYAPLAGPVFKGGTTLANASYTQATTRLTSGAADEKNWDVSTGGQTMRFRLVNDAYTAARDFLYVTRNGYAPGTVGLSADTLSFTGNPVFGTPVPLASGGTGAATAAAARANLGVVAGTAGGTFAAGDDGRFTPVATGTTTPRSLANRAADRLNARDFGAVGDGAALDSPALNAMMLAARNAGKDGYIPAGTYRVTPASPMLLQPITLHLDDGAVIFGDDSSGSTLDMVNNAGQGGDYTILGGTFKGRADVDRTECASMIHIYNAGVVRVERATFRYCRLFSCVIDGCRSGTITHCRAYRSLADSLGCWHTPDFTIAHNFIEGSNDDSISAPNYDDRPPRAGGVIAHNTIVDGQGIRVLGARQVTIQGNLLKRVVNVGVEVGINGTPGTGIGNYPQHSIKILDNTFTDAMKRPEPSPRNGFDACINLVFLPRAAGGGAAAPGDPAPGTGSVVPLLGSGAGTFCAMAATPNPGTYWADVSRNSFLRTKPAVAAYADWGEGASRWVGDSNAPAGQAGAFYTGPVTDAQLQVTGIAVRGAMRQSRIADNTFNTGAVSCIAFGPAVQDGDYDGLDIAGNSFANFTGAAINWPASGTTTSQMRVRSNSFNGDPQFRSPNRATGGTWASAAALQPAGVFAPSLNGMALENNSFENLALPSVGGMWLTQGNSYFGNCPVIGSFSATNAGIGTPPAQGSGWQYVQKDCDPRSASYGRVLALPVPAVARANNPLFTGETSITTPIGTQLREKRRVANATANQGYSDTVTFDGSMVMRLLNDADNAATTWLALTRTGITPTMLTLTATSMGLAASNHGFFGAAPVAKPVVTGSRSTGAMAVSLLAALVALGLVTDNTTA